MNTNNIIKYYDIKNITNSGFILHNDKNNEIIYFYGKYAIVRGEPINYGLVINGIVRRDKCDDIGDLRSFFKAGNSVYAISTVKQCIVCIDPKNIIITNHVFFSSLGDTYDHIICDNKHIYAVSSECVHMKKYDLNLDVDEQINFLHKNLTPQVIAENTFLCLEKSRQDPLKLTISIFTSAGVQEKRDFIINDGQRYYLSELDYVYVLNSNYFIVKNNEFCLLVSFQTNCVVQKIKEDFIRSIEKIDDDKFVIHFTFSSNKQAVLCCIDPCCRNQTQTGNVLTIENITS